MVDVKANGLDRFLANPDPGARVVLLAGRDRGRIKEAAKRIQSHWLDDAPHAINLQVFHASEWRGNPNLVLEALLSPTLMGGQRLIRVVDADKGLAKTIESWLDICGQAPEALIVLEAGDLAKSDGLRKLASNASNAACLFFYADEARDVAALIREVLINDHHLQVPSQVEALLLQSLGADRAISRGELEKLALYVGDELMVTVEHVMAVVSDAAELEFEALLHATSLGDFKAVDREYFRLINAGKNPNAVLSLVQNHFAKLYELRVLMDSGLNFAVAAGRMRPPLFWKSKSKYEAALTRWSDTKLHKARTRLLDGFVDLRTTGRPEIETAHRVLFALASIANSVV